VEQQREINMAAKLSLETYANNFMAYCQRNSDGHTEALIRAIKVARFRTNIKRLHSRMAWNNWGLCFKASSTKMFNCSRFSNVVATRRYDMRNVQVCQQLSRLLCAGGVVSCKSAKDRTSMFITWSVCELKQKNEKRKKGETEMRRRETERRETKRREGEQHEQGNFLGVARDSWGAGQPLTDCDGPHQNPR